MNKDFFEDIVFWLDDMYWHTLNEVNRLTEPIRDVISKLPPIQRYKNHKHEEWQKRNIRIEDIKRTFCRELKLPKEFNTVSAYNNSLKLSDEEFNSLLDDYFKKHLQDSKQLGASELICSSYLPLYIEEQP